MQSIQDQLQIFNKETSQSGWEQANFNFLKYISKSGLPYPEDQRSSDWLFLLPLSNYNHVLVVGVGFGEIITTMAARSNQVTVLDQSDIKLNLLKGRCQDTNINNVNIIPWDNHNINHDMKGPFDLIILNLSLASNIKLNWEQWATFLKVNLDSQGTVVILGGNKFSPLRLFKPKTRENDLVSTLPGYKKFLINLNLTNIKTYSLLPYADGIPLFCLDLECPRMITFFMEKIFPLFQAVSPEVKRMYHLPFLIARLGLKIASLFKITGLVRYFFPSYLIISNK